MNEITTREENLPATLDSYAQQGRMFLFNAAQNLIQFGRVLIEAKPLVPRGQFEGWVKNNFGISERTAQGYMAVYRRFGVKEQYRNVQFSKLQEMLALPEGTEEQFSAEHNLDDMSAREIKRAVQQAKAEAQAEIEKERTAREAAEAKIREMESREPELPEDVIAELGEKDRTIQEYKAELERVGRTQQELIDQRNTANRELADAKRDLQETEDMLTESQQEYNRMQTELLNAQSAIAKGDAERNISQQLTAEDFASAVRQFVSSVAQMPYMGTTFATMDNQEIRQYDEFLQTVEDWAKRARKALNTIDCEVLIDGQ